MRKSVPKAIIVRRSNVCELRGCPQGCSKVNTPNQYIMSFLEASSCVLATYRGTTGTHESSFSRSARSVADRFHGANRTTSIMGIKDQWIMRFSAFQETALNHYRIFCYCRGVGLVINSRDVSSELQPETLQPFSHT